MSKHPAVRVEDESGARRSARLRLGASLLTIPAAAAAAVIPASSGASAAPASAHRLTVAPSCADKSKSAPIAARPAAPSSVEHLAAGGAKYVYDIGSQRLSFPVLPAGFNAETASAAQLAQYGLSTEPAEGAARASWLSLVDGLHHQSAPSLAIKTGGRSDVESSHANTGTGAEIKSGGVGGVTKATTSIWSGYVSYLAGKTTHYSEAVGDWNQDATFSTSCSGATHLIWVGVGGYNSSELLQVGTNQSNQDWYEWLGPNGVPIQIFPNNLKINVSDAIEAYVTYATPANGGGTGGTAWFVVVDKTTDQYSIASLSNAGQDWNGSSAEFVDERTTFSNGPSPLDNFGTTHWSYAAAESLTDSGPVALANLGYVQQLNMTDPAGKVMANAGNEGVNGDAYSDYWDRCS